MEKAFPREKFPDIILSDVMMPEMDGIEMFSRLKTGFVSQLSALERGADAYRTEDAFVMKVRNLLEKILTTKRSIFIILAVNLPSVMLNCTENSNPSVTLVFANI